MSELTPWFPFSTPPVRHGVYNVSCRDGNQSGKWYGCFRDGKWSYWVCDNRGKDRAIREASRASYLERAPTYGTWRGLTKADCLAMVAKAGIELPAMYKLGYVNNNCIGCVKGQAGYWNKIRRDFPDVFERMAQVEETLGRTINVSRIGGVRKHISLRELDPNAGNYEAEPNIECGIACELASAESQTEFA